MVAYFEQLPIMNENDKEPITPETVINDKTSIEQKEVEAALQKLKKRESLGLDNISNNLLQYSGNKLNQQLTMVIG